MNTDNLIKSASNTTKDLVNGLLSNLKQRYDHYDTTRNRSERWNEVREEFLDETGHYCKVCGKTTKLNVHHIIPFHINPELELDKDNLITLCVNRPLNCHYFFGHLLCWRSYNPLCRYDVEIWRQKIEDRKGKYVDDD